LRFLGFVDSTRESSILKKIEQRSKRKKRTKNKEKKKEERKERKKVEETTTKTHHFAAHGCRRSLGYCPSHRSSTLDALAHGSV
jgi:hypothetical protein